MGASDVERNGHHHAGAHGQPADVQCGPQGRIERCDRRHVANFQRNADWWRRGVYPRDLQRHELGHELMRLALLLGVALASFAAPAMAQVAGNPVELYSNGQKVGTSANPLVVTGGGGGGSSGSITAAGTNGTLAQGVQGINGGVPVSTTAPGAGVGTAGSVSPPSTLTQIGSGTVVHPGALYVMNESAATIQLWLQGMSGPILIAPGAGANNQGADWTANLNMPWFVGTFTINGPAGSQAVWNAN